MRIALITRFPKDPASPSGGVEAVSVNLVRALANLSDLDVQVVTTDRTSSDVQVGSWSGAAIHRLGAGRGPLLAYAISKGRRQVQEYIRKLKPDAVHAHDTYGIMVKGLPLPRVFTVHDFIYSDTSSSGG